MFVNPLPNAEIIIVLISGCEQSLKVHEITWEVILFLTEMFS